MSCTPREVFDVLLDAYLYKHWVVGSKDIRGRDASWPAVGSAFYHRMGAAAAEVKDKTEILELDEPHRLVLRTFSRPIGIGRVEITTRPAPGGTIVSILEEPEEGTRLRAFTRLLDPFVYLRNIEGLRRLERVVQIRSTCKNGT